MHEEVYRVHAQKPIFLHCCPWWLLRTPLVNEVAGYAFESGNGNLPAYFIGGNIPVGLRNAIRMYDGGYQKGLKKRMDDEREKHGR
jgi:hypothetical protein